MLLLSRYSKHRTDTGAQMTNYINASDNDFVYTDKPEFTGIIAVIPEFNKERFITSVVITARKFAHTVIVVDDGSTDRTAYLAEQAGARVICQPINMGKAQALNAGFREARRIGDYRVVVYLDGDAQHDARDIPTVVAPVLEQSADVVIGSRFLVVKSDIPGWRQIDQHTLTKMTDMASGMHTTDSQSGFRAFSPAAVEALNFTSTDLSVESEMQFLFNPAGLKIVEAPVNVRYLDGNKRNPMVHGLQVLDSLLSLVARNRPLLFFSLPGLVCTVVGLIFGQIVLQTRFASGTLPLGMAALVAFIVSGGLTIRVTGVVLHSMRKFADRIDLDIRTSLSLYTYIWSKYPIEGPGYPDQPAQPPPTLSAQLPSDGG